VRFTPELHRVDGRGQSPQQPLFDADLPAELSYKSPAIEISKAIAGLRSDYKGFGVVLGKNEPTFVRVFV
jgi:hypothetical protein